MVSRSIFRVNFVGLDIFGDEDVDQFLSIVWASRIKSRTDFVAGSTLIGGTKLSRSVVHFFRGPFFLFA